MKVNFSKILHQPTTPLIVRITKHNWYSFAPLLASLRDLKDLAKKFEIKIVKTRDTLYQAIKEATNREEENKKSLVLYSFCTTDKEKVGEEIKELGEKFGKNIFLICGGPHPSGDPKDAINMGFNVIIRGEGEESLKTFLSKILGLKNWDNFPSPQIIPENFDEKKENSSGDLDGYLPYSRWDNLYPPIEISRGCPFGCYFCQTTYLSGRRMRHRSLKSIDACIEAYKEIFRDRGQVDIRFISPNALAYGGDGVSPNLEDVENLLRLCTLKNEMRVFFGTFPSEVRPEFVTRKAARLIAEYTSNRKVHVGGQSGSEEILKKVHRGHNVNRIREAVDNLLEAGLIPVVDFIFGFPMETDRDQIKTLKLIEEILDQGGEIRVHYFTPLSGTPLYKTKPATINKEVYKII
ncbi:MAG: TIGR04013 family B12-binding domain/radical SAM domain-containing protein [Candidatus Wukongarchaeota archaeon]|nr:TIGR04013 family B12-binding domain/radical SAM domain-containing protein [Candidatus Wukongarchaeota archaeon]